MTSQDEAVRRSLNALRPDADEHPGADALEAYVEGRLSDDQRAEVDRLAASSAIVAEDLADLQAIHRTISAAPVARRDMRWGRAAAMVAVAASLVMAVWVSQRQPAPVREAVTTASAMTSAQRDAVAAAIRDGRIAVPGSIAALTRPQGSLLGDSAPARFNLEGPLGTAVLSTTPTFTWEASNADAYTVAIFDEHFSEVARARVPAASWRCDLPLTRGATYVWQVTAHRGSIDDTEPKPPRPDARFLIVDERVAAAITDLQKRLESDPLSLGILMAEEGLIADARLQLQRAASQPATADAANRLLESLAQGTPITTKPAQ